MAEDIKKENTPEEEEDIQLFTLTDEDGNESDYELLMSMDIEGQTYMAFIPADDEESEEYVILKLVEEDGEEVLLTIDDDDEFERVAEIFDDELASLDDEEEQ